MQEHATHPLAPEVGRIRTGLDSLRLIWSVAAWPALNPVKALAEPPAALRSAGAGAKQSDNTMVRNPNLAINTLPTY